MKLLTQEQASKITVRARKEVVRYGLRFGQALFNCLPDDIYRNFTGTEYDFYYWENSTRVIQTFYEHYVEK